MLVPGNLNPMLAVSYPSESGPSFWIERNITLMTSSRVKCDVTGRKEFFAPNSFSLWGRTLLQCCCETTNMTWNISTLIIHTSRNTFINIINFKRLLCVRSDKYKKLTCSFKSKNVCKFVETWSRSGIAEEGLLSDGRESRLCLCGLAVPAIKFFSMSLLYRAGSMLLACHAAFLLRGNCDTLSFLRRTEQKVPFNIPVNNLAMLHRNREETSCNLFGSIMGGEERMMWLLSVSEVKYHIINFSVTQEGEFQVFLTESY